MTLLGLMQNMRFFYNLDKANDMPIDKQVGSAGGTVIVIKSSMLITS